MLLRSRGSWISSHRLSHHTLLVSSSGLAVLCKTNQLAITHFASTRFPAPVALVELRDRGLLTRIRQRDSLPWAIAKVSPYWRRKDQESGSQCSDAAGKEDGGLLMGCPAEVSDWGAEKVGGGHCCAVERVVCKAQQLSSCLGSAIVM